MQILLACPPCPFTFNNCGSQWTAKTRDSWRVQVSYDQPHNSSRALCQNRPKSRSSSSRVQSQGLWYERT